MTVRNLIHLASGRSTFCLITMGATSRSLGRAKIPEFLQFVSD